MTLQDTDKDGEETVRLRTGTVIRPKALAVGCSTGGPEALISFFKALDASLGVPVFVTQHMPATFTNILCQQLTRHTTWQCEEGVDGATVKLGHIYLSPGNYHMEVRGDSQEQSLHLTQEEKENFCRPSVEPMLRSLHRIFGRHLLVVILTGMGHDGLEGARLVAEDGGYVLAQSRSSSVVWGMPGAVAQAGLCNRLGTPEELAFMVQALVKVGILP